MEEMENINNTAERDIEVRSNGTQVFSEPYSAEAISRLKNLVLTFFSQGDRKFYSIAVDGETVVSKNSDGRKFDNYLRFMTPHTRVVEVKMYQGQSPNCNKHQFYQNQGSLGGVNPTDVQVQINRALEAQRLQHELDLLRKELDEKNKKLKKYKKQTENGESGMDKLKGVLTTGAEVLGALGWGPKKTLAGVPEQPVEVTIEPQAETSNQEQKQPTQTQQIFNDLIETYGEDGVKNAMGWLTVIAADPVLQEKIKAELQTKKTDQNGQA